MAGDAGSPRRLWAFFTPGLTGAIFLEEARKLGFKDHEAQLALTEHHWLALRDACFARLGVAEAPISETWMYQEWRAGLRQYQQLHGIDPSPGGAA